MQPVEVIALDVGDRRIGLARANSEAKLPEPMKALDRQQFDSMDKIADELRSYGADRLVIGMPWSLSGDASAQTKNVQDFCELLSNLLDVPMQVIDERLSTVESGKWRTKFPAADEDSLAACIILDRYFNEVKN